MARPNPIRSIMAMPLPSITYQRRKSFRPSTADINYAYNIINRYVFDGVLVRPEITQGTIHKAWGICNWYNHEQETGSWCNIRIMDKWFCHHWFMNTLAHEMIHQYQYDVYRWEYLDYYGRPMYDKSAGHGPSFFVWRERFEHYGLNLKTWFRQRKWFIHQDFNKC